MTRWFLLLTLCLARGSQGQVAGATVTAICSVGFGVGWQSVPYRIRRERCRTIGVWRSRRVESANIDSRHIAFNDNRLALASFERITEATPHL